MAFLLLLAATFLTLTNAQTIGDGTLRLVINSQSTIYYTSGIVEVYYNNTWGTICSTSTFGQTEADVVCRQQGFTGASSYSTAGQQSYGTPRNSIVSSVNCGTVTNYLVLFQCDVTFMSDTCLSSNAVTVNCLSTRIWDSAYSGQLRLQRGRYSSEGLVEVYCNGRWGTICDDSFVKRSADTICNQLGYTDALNYNNLVITGNTSQPIWLNNVACSSVYSCLSTCQSCTSSEITNCQHREDVTVQCNYDSDGDRSDGRTGTCDFTDLANAIGQLVGIIVGVIIGFIVLVVICATLPICICCCLGVGIGAAAAKA